MFNSNNSFHYPDFALCTSNIGNVWRCLIWYQALQIKHSLYIKSCISLIQMSPQLSSDYNIPPLFLFILKFIFSKLFWQMFL